MPIPIDAETFKLLRDLIENACGISLGDEKAYLIETRLGELMRETGAPDYGTFYRMASHGLDSRLRDRIVDAMTTNETLWFRDEHPFVILREKLLPPLIDHLKTGARFRVRIWSAASSTGQEPYSIAMTILEACRACPELRPDQFEILATDISPSALEMAQAGRYDAAAMARGLPDLFRERYFRKEGTGWFVQEEVRQLITFRKFNLQDSLEPLGKFDIVFMRYVAIYFADAFKRKLFANVARALAPDGYLIISAVETLMGISEAFQPLQYGEGTYHRCQLA